MNRSIGRIISKLLGWGLEILAAYLTIYYIQWSDWEKDFITSLLVSAFAAYFICAIAIIIVWVFNFLNKFNDYDSFSDGLYGLGVAPLTLFFHVLKHPINIFMYLIGKSDEDDGEYEAIFEQFGEKINLTHRNLPRMRRIPVRKVGLRIG